MSSGGGTLLRRSLHLYLMGFSLATTIQSDYSKVSLTEAQQGCTLMIVNYPYSQMYGKSYFCALQCGALEGCTSYCQTSSGCTLLKALFAMMEVGSSASGGTTSCYTKNIGLGTDIADGKTVEIRTDFGETIESYKHKNDLTNYGDCPGSSKLFYTKSKSSQWISVDLGQEYLVNSVVIGCNTAISYYTNREIRVGNNPPASLLDNQVFSLFPESMPSHYIFILKGNTTRGRYVQLYYPGTGYVTLSYIQVYGQSISD